MHENRFLLDLGNYTDFYKDLLGEEDFDFGKKDITVELSTKEGNLLEIVVKASSIHELKIGLSSVMKSIEVITKTEEVSGMTNGRRD